MPGMEKMLFFWALLVPVVWCYFPINPPDVRPKNPLVEYLNYEELLGWYSALAKQHPNILEYTPSIGRTLENRSIATVRLTSSSSKARRHNKPVVYFQSLMHAREWLSGSVMAYITEYLVAQSGKKSSIVAKVLEKADIIITPVVNPDGYHYSHTTDSLWRKNRAPLPASNETGVDLNRNFPNNWSTGINGYDPKKEDYQGASAESELEVQAIINYLGSRKILGVVDFHGYGKLLLFPPGYTNKTDTPQFRRLHRVGRKMAEISSTNARPASPKVKARGYTPLRIIDLYRATGSLIDWVFEKSNQTSLCYAIELPPEHDMITDETGYESGFQPCPSIIRSAGKELIPSINYFLSNTIITPKFK